MSELDADRYEVRKLEFFPDGTVGFASQDASSPGTDLGTAPVPQLSEINSDPQFAGESISEAEFDRLWRMHVASHI